MYLIVTRSFPPDTGGMQNLMWGLTNAISKHYMVKVFADHNDNNKSLDENVSYSIERIGGPKLIRKYRKAYLINDFIKAESYMIKAIQLMPLDPVVNDHYGDILWKLNRKIQARYFWSNVLKMDDAEEEMINKINIKLVEGIKNS